MARQTASNPGGDRDEPGWTELTGPERAVPGWGLAGWDTEPGFEFDARARAIGRDPYSPGLFGSDEFSARDSAPHGAQAEWRSLIGSLRPPPPRRSRFAEFRAALQFRGAGLRVIVPILTMVVFGTVLAVVVGANNSHAGPAPPPAALGFAPAVLAGTDFTAAASGRGIAQDLSGVASNGAELVAVGSQQGARIARAQFFVSSDDGRSWATAAVRASDGGPPPPGYAARFVAAGPRGWVAIGPESIWTSPDGRTWTLASTAGLPLHASDQISVLQHTAAGFLAAGFNGPQAGATPVLFLSADGLSWRRIAAGQLGLPAGPGRALTIRYAAAHGTEILIAGDVSVPGRGTAGAAWLSRDNGTTWTLAVPSAVTGHGAQDQISGVAASTAGFVLTRPAIVTAQTAATAKTNASTKTSASTKTTASTKNTASTRHAVDVYRSADGTKWTFAATVTAPAGFTATMLSGGPAGLVISGLAGPSLAVFTSADGVAWQPAPALGPAASQQVCGLAVTQGGAVVAVGTTAAPAIRQPMLTVLPAGRPATAGLPATASHPTTNHVNVTALAGAADPQLAVNDVAVAHGQLIAVGGANGYPAAWISADGGSTWTRASGQTPAVLNRPGVGQLTSVTYGADGWLAVGDVTAAAPAHPLVLASGNGRVWIAADSEPTFSQPGLVTEQAAAQTSTAQASTAQAAAQSSTAQASTAQPSTAQPSTAQPGAPPAPGYVIVGYQAIVGRTVAAVWYSTGLTGWQRATDATAAGGAGALDGPGASRQMRAVTASPRGFTAVGADGNAPAAWASADGGRTWTQQNVPLPVGAVHAVLTQVASSGRALAAAGTALTTAGQQVPFTASSSDGGATWTEALLPVPQGQGTVTALTAAGGKFWATGTFGAARGQQNVVIWSSPSGSAWTAVTPGGRGLAGPGIQAITGLTASGGTLTGVGYTATPTAEQPVFWQSPVR